MSNALKAVIFNAIPLFVVAVAYAAVTIAVVPVIWRDRRRAHGVDWAVSLVFPAVAAAAGVFGVLVVHDRDAVGGELWPALGATAVAFVPAVLLLLRLGDRDRLFSGRKVWQAEQRASARDRELGVVSSLSPLLARARTTEDACKPLVRAAVDLLAIGFAGVAMVVEDGKDAVGVYGERNGEATPWWQEVRVDLRNEPSGIASAVFDAAPVTVFDIASSTLVSPRLAEQVGARSGAWIPMLADERVIGVLVVATTGEKHAFTHDELGLLQALAGDAALALARIESARALADAVERERTAAEVTRRVHAQLDPDNVRSVALEEVRRVLRIADGDDVAIEDADADGMPIEVHGTRVASLVVRRADPLSSGEEFFVATVAHEIGSSLQTAELIAENRRRLEQQGALLHAAQVVTSELDLDAVLSRLVQEVANLLDADAADCYLLDAEHGVLRCAAVHGLAEEVVGFEFSSRRGLAGEALRAGRPVIGDDYAILAASVPHPAYAGFAQAIAAPMTWSGETWGVLGVGLRDGSRSFDDNDLELLEAFASLASLALRNAESFAERTRQARVQRAFYRIASLLGEPVSLTETHDAAAQAATEALGGDAALMLAATPDGLAAAGGYELSDTVRALRPPEAFADCAATGQVLAASDLADDERLDWAWQAMAFASLLVIPVSSDPAAVVVVLFRERRDFAHDDLELAQHLARAARGAFDRARMFESERTARSLSQQLARTGTLLATELDPGAVATAIVEEAAGLLDADAASLSILEGDELSVSAAVGEGGDELIGARAPSTGWAGGDVVQSRAPVAVDDLARGLGPAASAVAMTAGHRAYLGVPLVAGDGSIHGVLAVHAGDPRLWREEELQALAALAANAAVVLSNAELYQRVAVEREQSVTILANIAEGVVAVGRDGRVVLWNAAAEEITGVPATEALGKTPAQVLLRDLESETGGTNRLVAIPRGRDEVWLSLSEAVMRDPLGAVSGRIFAFRDISAERGLEQLKSDFVSTVSVELRTPLTSIYGFAQTLLRQDIAFTEDERKTFLEFIARESERLTEIVDALLDVARLDVGELNLSLEPTDVNSIVSDVVAGAARENGHRIVAEVDPDAVDAQADATRLREVLDQLVSNAVKYSPSGGTITVSARRDGDHVEVAVSDEGVGVAPLERERIFTKFYKTGDQHVRGAGLGLFIAQGLVREMGATISLDSEEGRGSRFAFRLPLAHS
ncbi:MAG TPA: GAF domain-containing protein [Gaiellaceae bacterium]|nr:GAF domain-containing protein [Gaiellaceae bacterium]